MPADKAVVVGAGPSGLKAATTLATLGYDVVIVESESEPGGVLGLLRLTGEYGIEAGRLLSRLLKDVERLEVKVDLEATASKLEGRELEVITPRGVKRYRDPLIVLATGFRNRTLLELGILGSRPAGVWTAWSALDLLVREGALVGVKPLVYVDDILGYAYCLEAAEEGVHVKALAPTWRLRIYGANRLERAGVEVIADDVPVAVGGGPRVQYVRTGKGRTIECDSLIVASRTPYRCLLDFEEVTPRFTVPGVDDVIVVGNALAPMEDPSIAVESSEKIVRYSLSLESSKTCTVTTTDPNIYSLAPKSIPSNVEEAIIYVKCKRPGGLLIEDTEVSMGGLCERLVSVRTPREERIRISFHPNP